MCFSNIDGLEMIYEGVGCYLFVFEVVLFYCGEIIVVSFRIFDSVFFIIVWLWLCSVYAYVVFGLSCAVWFKDLIRIVIEL